MADTHLNVTTRRPFERSNTRNYLTRHCPFSSVRRTPLLSNLDLPIPELKARLRYETSPGRQEQTVLAAYISACHAIDLAGTVIQGTITARRLAEIRSALRTWPASDAPAAAVRLTFAIRPGPHALAAASPLPVAHSACRDRSLGFLAASRTSPTNWSSGAFATTCVSRPPVRSTRTARLQLAEYELFPS